MTASAHDGKYFIPFKNGYPILNGSKIISQENLDAMIANYGNTYAIDDNLIDPDDRLIDGREKWDVDNTNHTLIEHTMAQRLSWFIEDKISQLSLDSFKKRAAILPDYKIQNANLGVYDATTTTNYLATVKAFRDEFYRVKGLIEVNGNDKTGVQADFDSRSFPTAIIIA